MARNVSVYSVYNTAGTYYFGSDRANALDTEYPYSNALLGSIFAYGDDNKKQVNHARYTQIEWFVQDTWKVSRRLTLDCGLRFYRVGDLYSKGATLGLFSQERVQPSKAGQLLFPACSIAYHCHLPDGQQDRDQPGDRRGLPVRPAGHVRHGVLSGGRHTVLRHSAVRQPLLQRAAHPARTPRRASRGTCSETARRRCAADSASPSAATGRWTISARRARAQGPMAAPPNFLAPTILYTNFASLAGGAGVLHAAERAGRIAG